MPILIGSDRSPVDFPSQTTGTGNNDTTTTTTMTGTRWYRDARIGGKRNRLFALLQQWRTERRWPRHPAGYREERSWIHAKHRAFSFSGAQEQQPEFGENQRRCSGEQIQVERHQLGQIQTGGSVLQALLQGLLAGLLGHVQEESLERKCPVIFLPCIDHVSFLLVRTIRCIGRSSDNIRGTRGDQASSWK